MGTRTFGAPVADSQRKEAALHYYRGIVNFEAGYYENALAEFQQVAAIDPYYKDIQRYIKEALGVLEKQRRELVQGAGEASTYGKSPTDFYFLGKSYYEKGDYARALEAFKLVLAKNPNDKFALYYMQLCKNAIPKKTRTEEILSPQEEAGKNVLELEKEISYVKEDIKSQEDQAVFLQDKAKRRSERADLIRDKEKQLKEQEDLLEEEKADYLAQAQISKKATKIKRESEKWKNMKEKLASEQPGTPAVLTDFPRYLSKADGYYTAMKEALRASRWNSAGLNAIEASLHYCDALLIYLYEVKSAYPARENITRLLLNYVKRADTEENVFRVRSILNVKKMTEEEDKPISRSQALFLTEEVEKIREWCKSLLP